MAWGTSRPEELFTAEELFTKLTVEDLRPLAALIGDEVPKRKTDLVPLLTSTITNPERLRDFYERLDSPSQNAIRMATFDPKGYLDPDKFEAQFAQKLRFDSKLTHPTQRVIFRMRSDGTESRRCSSCSSRDSSICRPIPACCSGHSCHLSNRSRFPAWRAYRPITSCKNATGKPAKE